MKDTYKNKTVLFIGCGNMGEPVLNSFIKAGFSPENIFVQVRTEEKINKLSKIYGIKNADLLDKELERGIDILVLAVKPQQLNEIDYKKPRINKNTILFSILAGKTIKVLEEATKVTKIARVMPNLPLMIGKGMSTFFVQELNEEEKNMVANVLSAGGEYLELKKEEDMHAATQIAGASPGIFFHLCSIYKNIAKEYGFSEESAERLTKQAFIGTGAFFEKNKEKTADELYKMVASKGGTTEATRNKFEELKLEETFRRAVRAGVERSRNM